MTNEPQDRMHELLCAYVLGEANDVERAEVERALLDSADLRREKARIESTIGLVQTALDKHEVLSNTKREEVLRSALPPVLRPLRPWWKETWVRAAASILFVSFALGGWTIYEELRRARDQECPPAVADGATHDLGLQGIGYASGADTQVARTESAKPKESGALASVADEGRKDAERVKKVVGALERDAGPVDGVVLVPPGGAVPGVGAGVASTGFAGSLSLSVLVTFAASFMNCSTSAWPFFRSAR